MSNRIDFFIFEDKNEDKERARFRATLVDGYLPQVVALEHGWWFPEQGSPGYGAFESNVNAVIPDDVFDPIYGYSAIKAIPCRVVKA